MPYFGRKRVMLLVPKINPDTFLFFFEKGDGGRAYSLRDYSQPGTVVERFAGEFKWTADEIRGMATRTFDAPQHIVTDLPFWHKFTKDLNDEHGLRGTTTVFKNPAGPLEIRDRRIDEYVLLDEEDFLRLPKAKKTKDVFRMRYSAQSEDWVSWNALRLLQAANPDKWWGKICLLASQKNPHLSFPTSRRQPELTFWRTTCAPAAYETNSRQRMCSSSNPDWVARAGDPKPVEGNSEIDIVFESAELIIYVEAKLGSDISMSTTYDPTRNQIIRNIDCLLEVQRGRTAYFWMFVRDDHQSLAYTTLMEYYKRNPDLLHEQLPHRTLSELHTIASGLTTLKWGDIVSELLHVMPADTRLMQSVKRELAARIRI